MVWHIWRFPIRFRAMTNDNLVRTVALRALTSLTLLLPLAGSARGQTSSALLLKPFPKEQLVQAEGGGVFLEGGHTQKSNADFRLGIYETQGMFRLMPG